VKPALLKARVGLSFIVFPLAMCGWASQNIVLLQPIL